MIKLKFRVNTIAILYSKSDPGVRSHRVQVAPVVTGQAPLPPGHRGRHQSGSAKLCLVLLTRNFIGQRATTMGVVISVLSQRTFICADSVHASSGPQVVSALLASERYALGGLKESALAYIQNRTGLVGLSVRNKAEIFSLSVPSP